MQAVHAITIVPSEEDSYSLQLTRSRQASSQGPLIPQIQEKLDEAEDVTLSDEAYAIRAMLQGDT